MWVSLQQACERFGSGTFGVVGPGEWNGKLVAVKILKGGQEHNVRGLAFVGAAVRGVAK